MTYARSMLCMFFTLEFLLLLTAHTSAITTTTISIPNTNNTATGIAVVRLLLLALAPRDAINTVKFTELMLFMLFIYENRCSQCIISPLTVGSGLVFLVLVVTVLVVLGLCDSCVVVVVEMADVTDGLLKPIVESIGMLNRVDTVADVTVMVSVNIHNV